MVFDIMGGKQNHIIIIYKSKHGKFIFIENYVNFSQNYSSDLKKKKNWYCLPFLHQKLQQKTHTKEPCLQWHYLEHNL